MLRRSGHALYWRYQRIAFLGAMRLPMLSSKQHPNSPSLCIPDNSSRVTAVAEPPNPPDLSFDDETPSAADFDRLRHGTESPLDIYTSPPRSRNQILGLGQTTYRTGR